MIRPLILTLFLSLPAADAIAGPGSLLSVEQAYSAIPHEQTRFLRELSRTRAVEATYLDRLFTLVDLAIVERVQMLRWMQSGGRQGSDTRNYDNLLEELSSLEVPNGLHDVHRLATEAIEDQRAYLERWRRNPGSKFDAGNRLVQSAHGKLLRAYQILIRTFPDEADHNRKAFFDHLCALDFI